MKLSMIFEERPKRWGFRGDFPFIGRSKWIQIERSARKWIP